ncbi:MAG TPA: NAD(P)/FAD-dependent oxidoreductase, partial [Acidobacteriota bacterium]|nr:NAD(P)/FAD-dependent oxidoreductase [Acidobacteriota bacterium]
MQQFEVVIVGGGPAGLSAALVLGRCLRTVLVCDSGQPRNAQSKGLHGFLTRDNILPLEFLEIARSQLQPYENVSFKNIEAIDINRNENGFEVTLANQTTVKCRKLLLATGVIDNLPPIDGVAELYGKNIFHCPYCDGWEVRGLPLVVYGNGERGHGLSLDLKNWSDQITLCTDGPADLSRSEKSKLEDSSIHVMEDRIRSIQPSGQNSIKLQFINGNSLEFAVMFFTLGC